METHLYLPVILATSLLTFAYTIRNAMVLPSLAELRRNPRDPKLLKRWSRNNLIVLSLCAAVGWRDSPCSCWARPRPLRSLSMRLQSAICFCCDRSGLSSTFFTNEKETRVPHLRRAALRG